MNTVKLDGQAITPSKVVCIGRNYVARIEELNNDMPTEPVIFIKANSAITDKLVFNTKDAVHYEGELSFLIRSNRIYAVGFGLDLTKRDVQANIKAKGLPWERAKSFDKSAVFSQFITFTGSVDALNIELSINGSVVQKASVSLMLTKPKAIIDEVIQFVSFEDNDILMTGTPKGVGAIELGDVFNAKVFDKNKLLIEKEWIVQ